MLHYDLPRQSMIQQLKSLDSCFYFLKPFLEALKFINILQIIELMKVNLHMTSCSKGMPITILLIYCRDPNSKGQVTFGRRGTIGRASLVFIFS